MAEPELLLQALTEADGATRDINFAEHLTMAGTLRLLDELTLVGTLRHAEAEAGTPMDLADAREFVQHTPGDPDSRVMLQVFFRDLPWVANLMGLITWDGPDRFYVELSFFPEDLRAKTFSVAALRAWVQKLCAAADSGEYYVRLENASWVHGDTSERGGVLMSHLDDA